MGYGARRLLIGIGAATAAGAAVLGQAAGAGAASLTSGAAGSAAARAMPGSVYVPASTSLTFGMHGAAVTALQKRLAFLHYYPGKITGYFGWPTMEAVWAFKEVQSGKAIPRNPDVVGPTMQQQLVNPKLPALLKPHATWSRIEINKNVGVLVLYRYTHIVMISHVATAAYCRPDGCGWTTPDGRFRALWFAAGWVTGGLGSMYNPIVFTPDGNFAIHGEPNPTATRTFDGVPLNAASHGCVRIPMDVANVLHTLIHISPTTGILIYIAGGNQPY